MLCQEFKALREKFTDITQMITKTCSAQKSMVGLIKNKLVNNDTTLVQGTIDQTSLQQTTAK
eukprot:7413547-Ditylum_brightwellii.AAC.1